MGFLNRRAKGSPQPAAQLQQGRTGALAGAAMDAKPMQAPRQGLIANAMGAKLRQAPRQGQIANAISSLGQAQRAQGTPGNAAPGIMYFEKGGDVKKTGPAIVHKGEKVLTAKQAKSPEIKKAVAKSKRK